MQSNKRTRYVLIKKIVPSESREAKKKKIQTLLETVSTQEPRALPWPRFSYVDYRYLPTCSIALLILKTLPLVKIEEVRTGTNPFPYWLNQLCGNFFFKTSTAVFLLDHPFLTNEELAAVPIVKVPPSGKYTGTKLKSVIRMLRGLLDQGIPSKELEVSGFCQ